MSTIKPKQPDSLVKNTGSIILNILGLMVGIAAVLTLWFDQGTVEKEAPIKVNSEQVNHIFTEDDLSNEQLLDSCACWGMES